MLCLMTISISVLTTGCGTKATLAPAFCSVATPFYPSRKDVLTDGTKRQIVTHNEIGVRLCGWQPPNKKNPA